MTRGFPLQGRVIEHADDLVHLLAKLIDRRARRGGASDNGAHQQGREGD
jgi:hypothetical protein